jgi:hypothetical protein
VQVDAGADELGGGTVALGVVTDQRVQPGVEAEPGQVERLAGSRGADALA